MLTDDGPEKSRYDYASCPRQGAVRAWGRAEKAMRELSAQSGRHWIGRLALGFLGSKI